MNFKPLKGITTDPLRMLTVLPRHHHRLYFAFLPQARSAALTPQAAACKKIHHHLKTTAADVQNRADYDKGSGRRQGSEVNIPDHAGPFFAAITNPQLPAVATVIGTKIEKPIDLGKMG